MLSVTSGGGGERERDVGVLTHASSCAAPEGRHIDAGAAAYHHPAGDESGRTAREHAPPPCQWPHRPLHSIHDRLSPCCVDRRIALRINQLPVSGVCAGFSAAAWPRARPYSG